MEIKHFTIDLNWTMFIYYVSPCHYRMYIIKWYHLKIISSVFRNQKFESFCPHQYSWINSWTVTIRQTCRVIINWWINWINNYPDRLLCKICKDCVGIYHDKAVHIHVTLQSHTLIWLITRVEFQNTQREQKKRNLLKNCGFKFYVLVDLEKNYFYINNSTFRFMTFCFMQHRNFICSGQLLWMCMHSSIWYKTWLKGAN